MNPVVASIRILQNSERDLAKQKARLSLAGKKPAKKEIKLISKYPPEIVNRIRKIRNGVFVAAFIPSAFRILVAGYNAFFNVNKDPISSALVGACAVALSETGILVCAMCLALSIKIFSRCLLWAGIIICTAMALVGNFEQARPDLGTGLFPYLESFTPTAMTLIMAYIWKEQYLDNVEEAFKYEEQLKEEERIWKDIFDNADAQPKWLEHYGLALKEEIYRVNNRSKSGKEALPKLDNDNESWLYLVQRELDADNWFSRALTENHNKQAEIEVNKKLEDEKSNIIPIHNKDGIQFGFVNLDKDLGNWYFECYEHGKQIGNYGTSGGALIAGHQHHRHSQAHNPTGDDEGSK